MGAYNFQKQFAPDIESGKKRCTIRARRKNGYVPKLGELLALYTGMRTRACKLLRRSKCKMIRPVIVRCGANYLEAILLEGRLLTREECLALARQDGFQSTEDFAAFFHRAHGPDANLYLIEW